MLTPRAQKEGSLSDAASSTSGAGSLAMGSAVNFHLFFFFLAYNSNTEQNCQIRRHFQGVGDNPLKISERIQNLNISTHLIS